MIAIMGLCLECVETPSCSLSHALSVHVLSLLMHPFYAVTAARGFLLPFMPVNRIGDTRWQHIITDLPRATAMGSDATAQLLRDIPPLLDVASDDDYETLELLHMLYGYAASAWVHGTGQSVIPAHIAEAFIQISARLKRPPMLGYTGMVLANWRLVDTVKGFVPDNIRLGVCFTDIIDEAWFFRVHIAIEAQAGAILHALLTTKATIAADDKQAVLSQLRTMQTGLVDITRTFHRMPDHCDPDVYYQQVRPFLMSFDEQVIFAGVTPNPSPLRGGSGAQSSIVPALLAGLGIQHQSTALTANLHDMRRYMPLQHQQFIIAMQNHPLRDYCAAYAPLRDAYNRVLQHLITFRRAHLYYARTYIFEKSTNPIGTGGTEYMGFLSKLIDETAEQRL